MDPNKGLFYVTADAGSSDIVSAVDVLEWARGRSKISHVANGASAYIYRATDTAGPNAEKPKWLVMWEFKDADFPAASSLKIIEMPNPGTIHRRECFSLQATYTAPSFSSTDLLKHKATNFIVAVIIVLNEEFKAEYDKYYEEEHIGALTKVPGWRRTRRFVESRREGNERAQKGEVQILQLHDYDPENYGIEGPEFKQATSTQWYKDMMANAVKTKDRRTYELYGIAESDPSVVPAPV